MFCSTLFVAAAAVFGVVSAQNYSTSGGNLTVVPDSVSMDLRQAWCRGQTANCPLVCGGQAYPNSCDATDLTYDCVCTDGSKPNISSYDAMLPSYICGQWRTDCVAAHPNDLTGQTACLSVVCGSKNASAVPQNGATGGSSPSSAAPSSTMTTKSGSSPTSSAGSSATTTGAAVALDLAKSYGTGALAVGMAAVFGLAL